MEKYEKFFNFFLLGYHYPTTKTRLKKIQHRHHTNTDVPLWPKLNYKHKQKVPNTGIPCFIALHFIALQRYCIFFYKLKVCGKPAHRAGLSVPVFQQHLLTLCLCITFW